METSTQAHLDNAVCSLQLALHAAPARHPIAMKINHLLVLTKGILRTFYSPHFDSATYHGGEPHV